MRQNMVFDMGHRPSWERKAYMESESGFSSAAHSQSADQFSLKSFQIMKTQSPNIQTSGPSWRIVTHMMAAMVDHRISARTIHPPQRCLMATHHSNLEALSAAEGSTTSGKKSTKEMPKLKLLSCGYSSPEDEFRDVVELSMEKNS